MSLTYHIDDESLKAWKIFAILTIVFLLAAAGLVAVMMFRYGEIDTNIKIEPALFNGLLTAYSVVFAFTTYEWRDIKAHVLEKFFFSLPLIFCFFGGISKYVGDILYVGYPTYVTLMVVFCGILFTILDAFVALYMKALYEELAYKRIKITTVRPVGKQKLKKEA